MADIRRSEDFVNIIKDRRTNPIDNASFNKFKNSVRDIFYNITGIENEKPLLIYGDEPNPVKVKVIGKTIISEVLRRWLSKFSIESQPVSMILYDDGFNRNSKASSFIDPGLLSPAQADELGSQSYACSPTPGYYVNRMWKLLTLGDKTRENILEVEGLTLESLIDESKKSIGEFNMFVREKIEQTIFPRDFKIARYNLRKLEQEVIKNEDLFETISNISKNNNNFPIFVTLKDSEISKYDSGFRRYGVNVNGNEVHIINQRTNEQMRRVDLRELQQNPNYVLSLNAESRAILIYTLAYGGSYITTGNSSYHKDSVNTWVNYGFPEPVFAKISNEQFRNYLSNKFASILLYGGTRELIKEIFRNSRNIISTDAEDFFKIIPKRERQLLVA